MSRLTFTVCAALLLAGCPKKDKDPGTATPTPGASPAGEMTMASASPTATATTSMDTNETSLTYRLSGAFGPYQFYELKITGDRADFVVKPMRTEEKRAEDKLVADDVAKLDKLISDTKFFDATETPRKVRISDIGESTLTVTKGGKTHTVKESGATMSSTDIKPLRRWLDDKVRLYLEKSGAKPSPKMTETPAK